MISLDQWYRKFFKLPLAVLLVAIVVTSLGYLAHSALQRERDLVANISQHSKMAALGIKEKNRVMLELVFLSAISNYNADAAVLCGDDNKVIVGKGFYKDCSQLTNEVSVLKKLVIVPIVGNNKMQFIYSIPRLSYLGDILALTLFTIFALGMILAFAKIIRRRVEADLINPLIATIVGRDTSESNLVIEEVQSLAKHQEEKQALEKEKSVAQALIHQSKQVSHDIRSPLSALKSIAADIEELPESSRRILQLSLQRIDDIASNLLARGTNEAVETEEATTTLLHTVVEEIVSEKRLEYKVHAGVEIIAAMASGPSLFAKVKANGLKRVISNLINNSIEAMGETGGRVVVRLAQNKDYAELSIVDNGKGIPQDIIEKVRERGFSQGKENSARAGSGLGLAHADEMIKEWGGDLQIESLEGVGTIMTLKFPIAEKPEWFLGEKSISAGDTVVILDDDQGIHETWAKKFESYIHDQSIKVVNLYSPGEVRAYFALQGRDRTHFLSDFELIGHQETGLDLIEELGLSSISSLITNHYSETKIQERCEGMQVQLLPKIMTDRLKLSIA